MGIWYLWKRRRVWVCHRLEIRQRFPIKPRMNICGLDITRYERNFYSRRPNKTVIRKRHEVKGQFWAALALSLETSIRNADNNIERVDIFNRNLNPASVTGRQLYTSNFRQFPSDDIDFSMLSRAPTASGLRMYINITEQKFVFLSMLHVSKDSRYKSSKC